MTTIGIILPKFLKVRKNIITAALKEVLIFVNSEAGDSQITLMQGWTYLLEVLL